MKLQSSGTSATLQKSPRLFGVGVDLPVHGSVVCCGDDEHLPVEVVPAVAALDQLQLERAQIGADLRGDDRHPRVRVEQALCLLASDGSAADDEAAACLEVETGRVEAFVRRRPNEAALPGDRA